MSQQFKAIGFIPAHLASVRFPRKILQDISGLPMIEHVRRRALLSGLDNVVVATCDDEIADVVSSYGGQIAMTTNRHQNGTSRVAEACEKYDCTHIVLIQGDEPLLLPRHLERMLSSIAQNPEVDAFNAIARLTSVGELEANSFVKCILDQQGFILDCFRQSPMTNDKDLQLELVHKILGIIAYKKGFLGNLCSKGQTPIEKAESIEQMRILEYRHSLRGVLVEPALPSLNEPGDLRVLLETLSEDKEQQEILDMIL